MNTVIELGDVPGDAASTRFSLRDVRRAWIALAIVGALVATMLMTAPASLTTEWLRRGLFWFLDALFIAWIVTTVVAMRDVLRRLDASSRRLMVALGAFTALLVLVAPRTHRIFYDEQIDMSVAQNLTDLHLAQMCNDGIVEYGALRCDRPEYNKEPYGYPHLLSVGYRLFGVSETMAQEAGVLVAGLTTAAIFVLTMLVTHRVDAAAFAALLFALLPEQLRWSHTAAVEPSTSLALTVAMLAAVSFVRLRTTTTLLWLVFASAWASYFRAESILIVLVAGVTLVLCAPTELRRPRAWWCALVLLLALTPELAHLSVVWRQPWGSGGARFAADFLGRNLRTNGLFYLADARFPVIVSILALAGVSLSRVRLSLWLWFVSMWSVFLFFYAGSYDYGADVRFSLLTYPPLAVCAGIGASRVKSVVHAFSTPRVAAVVVTGLLLFQFLWYVPSVRSVGEEAWAARADVEFARRIARELPPNSLVLTQNPGMFQTWGVNAAQLSIAAGEPAYVADMQNRFAGGVYLHWNFWCNVADPVQRGFCDRAIRSYPTRLREEYRERDYRFAFYRIEGEGSNSSPSTKSPSSDAVR